MQPKKWVWQHENYPAFPYDHTAVQPLLTRAARATGMLEGMIRTLDERYGSNIRIEAITEEIVSSSRIEGEILRRESVRDSVRKRLERLFDTGKNHATRHTDALADLLMDSSFNRNPLDRTRLHGWHNALFPTGYSGLVKIRTAAYRDETMQVVSGWGANEKVHYEAVSPENIEAEMTNFFDYVNFTQADPFIKSAIAHLWFVIIHPYDDGNGRIARAVTNYVLAKELGLSHQYFSLSLAVMHDKKRYYELLEQSNNLFYNRGYDFTPWIQWHSETIIRAVDFSLKQIEIVLQKAKFWERARTVRLNEKQIKVLNKLLDAGKDGFTGGLTNKKYRAMTGVTQVTASRHLKEMVEKGLLKLVEGKSGRSTRYEIAWE
jgi:Fic family protein